MALFACCSMGSMSAQNLNDSINHVIQSQIILSRNIKIGGPAEPAPGQGPRTPDTVPIDAYLYDDGILSVDATALDACVLDVSIVDADDNEVLTGTYSSTSVFYLNAASLPTGTFTLVLSIIGNDDEWYEGEFEIEP